jgi:hypothetical protein
MSRLTSLWSVVYRATLAVVFVLLCSAAHAAAQNVASASIVGKVTDESGAGIPGATITVTGSALQVPHSAVSDPDGTYRVVDLPVGTYRASYELSGFQSYIRDELRLSVGFVAKVDVILKVGAIAETVTVSGASPVVDVVNTTSSTNFPRETLESMPRGRALWDLIPLASGVSTRGSPDVGDSNLGNRQDISSYGVAAQPTLEIEGINVQTDDSFSSAVYLSYFGMDEVQIKAAGNTAEVGFPGVNMVAVVKSGGDAFHGTYVGSYESPTLQSDNITPALQAQGLRQTSPLQHYYDMAGDLGGRLIRDKLWFYSGLSRQDIDAGLVGFAKAPGPDGVYLTADDVPGDVETRLDNENMKFSYQASRTAKLVGVWQHTNKFAPEFGATRLRPLEAEPYYKQPGNVWKGEIQAAPSNGLLINALGGYGGYFANYQDQPGSDVKGNPSRFDQRSGLYTGPQAEVAQRPQNRYEARGSVSYFPDTFAGGKHQFKAGATFTREDGGSGFIEKASGDYLLTFNGTQPLQITTYNFPIVPVNRLNTGAVYLTDTWTLSRLTMNLGVRYERYHSFYPDQSSQAGQFSAGGNFPGVDILTWNRVVPRLGAAWDLRGNGKSVLKSTYGWYSNSMGNLYAQLYNPNGEVTTNYRWHDLNGNGDYDPGEVDLRSSGVDFLSAFGGTNQILNPGLQQPVTYEYTAKLEQELVPNTALSVTYVYKRVHNLYNKSGQFTSVAGVNVLRPYGVYTVPIARSDPGPDGIVGTADDGGPLTIWDYPATYAGGAFNGQEIVNNPADRDDYFHSIEATFTKRYSSKWNALASFWVTKNHQRIQATPQSANDDAFPIDETWHWEGRVSGSYTLPYGIQFSGLLRSQSGVFGQRTARFTGIPQQSTVTLRMDPYGTEQGPTIAVLNLKGSKRIALGGSRRLDASFEIFNAANSSAATALTYLSGPSFGFVTGVVPPRVARFGLSFSF